MNGWIKAASWKKYLRIEAICESGVDGLRSRDRTCGMSVVGLSIGGFVIL